MDGNSTVPWDVENDRAVALAGLDILDSPAESTFDDIVMVAAHACDTPIAIVSLLDERRQWFKAKIGLDAGQTDIDQSVCMIDIDEGAFLEIRDLSLDPRTSRNPLVTGERAFRYYAGAPLILRSGAIIGRLCVIDTVPRPDGLGAEHRNLLEALARQVSDHLELRTAARHSERMLLLQDALMQIADVIRASTTVSDMTRRTAEIVGLTLSVDRAAFGAVDATVEVIEIDDDWTAPGADTIVGRHRFEDFGAIRAELIQGEPLVIADVLSDPRTAADPAPMLSVGVKALVNMPVRDRDRTIAVFIVNSAGSRSWRPEELWFLRSVADRLEVGVSRHRSEEQQQLLNAEINHRLKNMLAMVQAIASQTLRAIPDRAPVETFKRRLAALSAAHDVLLQKSWAGADLRAVVEAVIETVGFAARVRLEGPPVALGPRAALSFSLVVHELMTNACKYGSLSRDEGGVDMVWAVAADGDRSTLGLRWRESGGPPVTVPTTRGFGSKLVGMGLNGIGGAEVRYLPEGLEVDFSADIADLLQG